VREKQQLWQMQSAKDYSFKLRFDGCYELAAIADQTVIINVAGI